jgi:hypothetical protein
VVLVAGLISCKPFQKLCVTSNRKLFPQLRDVRCVVFAHARIVVQLSVSVSVSVSASRATQVHGAAGEA